VNWSGLDRWGVVQTSSSLVEEFKKFALKGNVIDLAIGIIIGGAFQAIVESLVKNIIMPIVGLFFPSEQGYLHWKIAVGQKEIPYGLFVGEIVNFLIVAVALFLFAVKFLGWISRSRLKSEEIPNKQELLLTEIRDLLKQQVVAKDGEPIH